jgi:hypothetical protein
MAGDFASLVNILSPFGTLPPEAITLILIKIFIKGLVKDIFHAISLWPWSHAGGNCER